MSAVAQPSEIAPLFADEPQAPQFINTLLYGPPGSGKSTAAATAPGPIVWVNAEGPNALAFARKMARDRGAEVREVRLERGVDPREQLRETLRYLKADGGDGTKTVVIDTLGKVRDLTVTALEAEGKKGQNLWVEVNKVVLGLVKDLRDMPVNLVVIAHQEIKEGEDGSDRIIQPLIGGKGTTDVPTEMDVVAYCGAQRTPEGVRYVGVLVEHKGRQAKDRSGGLGSSRDLDLSEWLAAFQAALGGGDADLPFAAAPRAEKRKRGEAEAVADA